MGLNFVMMFEMFSNITANLNFGEGNPPDPTIMFDHMKYLPLIILTTAIFQFGWQWSVGTSLHSKLPENTKMNIKVFKAFLIVPFIYTIVISVGMGFLFKNMSELMQMGAQMDGQSPPDELPKFLMFILIFILLHLFSMVCIFYNIYFIARSLKSVEIQETAKGDQYIGEFFLTWFLLIGIWFLQPRINTIFSETEIRE
ncbi:MAG: hypothetical protein COA58_00985 [Bacteroidetes bacterium]|nr:MAG: hypothetical protein COA58_00985 [Bacteroidota bacterium]